MNKHSLLVVLGLVILGVSLQQCGSGDSSPIAIISPEPEPEPRIRFGLFWDSLSVDSGSLKSGQTLSHLLDPYGISPGKVATLAANSKDVYRVTSMRQGKSFLGRLRPRFRKDSSLPDLRAKC